MKAITFFAGLGAGLGLLASCAASGGDDMSMTEDQQHELSFHGEREAFPGFSYSTGAIPAASPVQLELSFSAGGKLTADAKATAGGSGSSLAVAGVPGSGVYALDAHLKAGATLHVHISGVPSYDGPIPGIDNLDIAMAGQSTFDPFLQGGSKAHLSVNLPETQLPPIPLGSIPGKLIITVSGQSTINSTMWGVCAGLDQGKVQFLTEGGISATIVLEPKIVISIPVVGDKEFPIPEVRFDTGSIHSTMDLGTVVAPEGGPSPASPTVSLAANASCQGATCKAPDTTSFTPYMAYTMTAENQCTTSQIYAFIGACVTSSATSDTCHAFMNDANNVRCGSCISTESTDAFWGALVDGQLNVGGCIGKLDAAQNALAMTYEAPFECQKLACADRCAGATDAQLDQCLTDAEAKSCKSYVDAANASYPTGAASACMGTGSMEDTVRYYADLFCGAP